MGPFSAVSDSKCRTPNLRLFQQFLSQRQLSSRAPGQKHAKGSPEFFAVPIRNANTRSAYYRAIQQFLDWVDRAGYQQVEDIEPKYENATSPEAVAVKALDKLETLIQHNQGINPPHSVDYLFNFSYGRKYTEALPLFAEIRRLIDQDTQRRAVERQ